MGYSVGVLKPIETGVTDTPNDGLELLESATAYNKNLSHLSVDDITPLQFSLPAAPYVASGGVDIDLEIFEIAASKIEQYCDILLIEGAGGALVPIDKNHYMIDLAKFLNASVLLVSHCSLGCINDTLLNRHLLDSYDIDYEIAFNCRDDGFESISKRYFLDNFEHIYEINGDISALLQSLLDKISPNEESQ